MVVQLLSREEMSHVALSVHAFDVSADGFTHDGRQDRGVALACSVDLRRSMKGIP